MNGYKIQPKFSLGEKVLFKSRGSQNRGELVETTIYGIIAYINVKGKKEYQYHISRIPNEGSGAILNEEALFKI